MDYKATPPVLLEPILLLDFTNTLLPFLNGTLRHLNKLFSLVTTLLKVYWINYWYEEWPRFLIKISNPILVFGLVICLENVTGFQLRTASTYYVNPVKAEMIGNERYFWSTYLEKTRYLAALEARLIPYYYCNKKVRDYAALEEIFLTSYHGPHKRQLRKLISQEYHSNYYSVNLDLLAPKAGPYNLFLSSAVDYSNPSLSPRAICRLDPNYILPSLPIWLKGILNRVWALPAFVNSLVQILLIWSYFSLNFAVFRCIYLIGNNFLFVAHAIEGSGLSGITHGFEIGDGLVGVAGVLGFLVDLYTRIIIYVAGLGGLAFMLLEPLSAHLAFLIQILITSIVALAICYTLGPKLELQFVHLVYYFRIIPMRHGGSLFYDEFSKVKTLTLIQNTLRLSSYQSASRSQNTTESRLENNLANNLGWRLGIVSTPLLVYDDIDGKHYLVTTDYMDTQSVSNLYLLIKGLIAGFIIQLLPYGRDFYGNTTRFMRILRDPHSEGHFMEWRLRGYQASEITRGVALTSYLSRVLPEITGNLVDFLISGGFTFTVPLINLIITYYIFSQEISEGYINHSDGLEGASEKTYFLAETLTITAYLGLGLITSAPLTLSLTSIISSLIFSNEYSLRFERGTFLSRIAMSGWFNSIFSGLDRGLVSSRGPVETIAVMLSELTYYNQVTGCGRGFLQTLVFGTLLY